MVTIETLRKSWKSRPRKAVVFWAFFCLIFAAGGLGFWLAMKYANILPDILQNTFNLMGTEWVMRDFVIQFGLPTGMMVTCLPAWILAQVLSKRRAAYLWVAIPSSLIVIAYLLCGILLLITPVHNFLPMKDKILKVAEYGFNYGAMGYAGLMSLCCFLALFYNVVPPLKYSRIYTLRRWRLKYAEDGADRRRVRRDFYRMYRKKQFKEMLGVLTEPYLKKDTELELIDEAIYYMKLNGGEASGEIKGYELDEGLEVSEEQAIGIYNQTLDDLELARNGDLSFLHRNNGEPRVIIKEVKVPVKPKKGAAQTVGGVPVVQVPPQQKPSNPSDPLWSPEDIH